MLELNSPVVMLREIKGDALRYLVRLVQFKNRAKHP